MMGTETVMSCSQRQAFSAGSLLQAQPNCQVKPRASCQTLISLWASTKNIRHSQNVERNFPRTWEHHLCRKSRNSFKGEKSMIVSSKFGRDGKVRRCRTVCAAVLTMNETQASTSRKVEVFWEWLKEKGVVEPGKTLFRVAEVPEGLGLVATGPVNERDDLFVIPESLLLSVTAAKASPIGRYLQDLPAWICVALFLLHEKGKPNSEWRPYLDLLPEELDSPFYWGDDDLKELEGTQLLGSVLGYRQHLEETYEEQVQPILESNSELWPQQVASLDAFAWAFGIVRSRTFPPLTGDDIALVPLADLVNHANGPYFGPSDKPFWHKKTVGFFNSQKPVVTLQPRRAYGAGQQITMDYGAEKPNSDLALDYGFIVDGGIGEKTRDQFQLTLEIPEDDRFADDKLDIVEINGLGQVCQFDLLRGVEPPMQLLAFMRLVAMSGPDAFLLESIFRNAVWEHVCQPISQENEESICVSMIEGLKSVLSAYETTVDEDTRILGSLDGDDRATRRKRLAVGIRLNEKRILAENLNFFETRYKSLEQIEYYAERRLRTLGLLDDSGNLTPWDELGF